MAKGRYKVNNINGFTKEQAIGKPVNYQYMNCKPIQLGVITDADENYLYVDFEHNNNNDLLIEVNNNRCSMEIKYD